MNDPRNPALEAAIANDPFDREAYLVYADWLEGQGDPRAQLIALQCSPHPEQHAGKAVRKLLADHQKSLLGPLARFASSLEWKYGFIHSVSLNDAAGPFDVNLANLMAHPSARFLVSLYLSSRHLATTIDALAAAPPTLRSLALGNEGAAPVALEALGPVLPRLGSLSLQGDFALDALARVPPCRLHKLTIIGRDGSGDLRGALGPALGELTELFLRGRFALDAIDLPALEVAELEVAQLTAEIGGAIATARWPKLRRLVVAAADPDTLAPLLQRADLPALTDLAIRRAVQGERVCAMLSEAPFAGQLRRLELSHGTLDDRGAFALADHAHAFDQLEELDVSDNPLSDDGYATLDSMGIVEIVDDRRYRSADE